MGSESELKTWGSDKLMLLMGYSQATVVQYVIGLGITYHYVYVDGVVVCDTYALLGSSNHIVESIMQVLVVGGGDGGVLREIAFVPNDGCVNYIEENAEFGFASHWRYKEGDCKHSSFVLQMVEWARWVVTWPCETMNKGWRPISYGDSSMPHCSFPFHAENCPHSYKSPCGHDGPVFLIMMENDKMSVQEFPANSTMMDLLERAGRGSSKWTPYRFPIKEELRPRLNHKSAKDPTCKLNISDVIELTPAISDKSLTKYKEEM